VLSSYNSYESLKLESLLEEYKKYNCFNPSIVYFGDYRIISFRAFSSNKKKPFNAYLLIFNIKDKCKKVLNLSTYYGNFDIANVADPKLTILNDSVWCTFNTGYSKGYNYLYLGKVFPSLRPPYLCDLKNRSIVEKNWAFFLEDGNLKALYSIIPLSIIRQIEKDNNKRIIKFSFEFYKNDDNDDYKRSNLSIGSQAIFRDNKLYLMAHKKFKILGRRLYFGVPVCIEKTPDRYISIVSKKKIIHSFLSLFGSTIKHNPNLWSCTYLSGFHFIDRKRVVIAYGINDREYGIKEIEFECLW
jgi:hypothetical protein